MVSQNSILKKGKTFLMRSMTNWTNFQVTWCNQCYWLLVWLFTYFILLMYFFIVWPKQRFGILNNQFRLINDKYMFLTRIFFFILKVDFRISSVASSALCSHVILNSEYQPIKILNLNLKSLRAILAFFPPQPYSITCQFPLDPSCRAISCAWFHFRSLYLASLFHCHVF